MSRVKIDDTFAEAFGMTAARLVLTAVDTDLARMASQSVVGHASSVIGCNCEAGIERQLSEDETPDGRPGFSLLFFAFNAEKLEKALTARIGQNVLTCPTTACYSGLHQTGSRIRVGGQLRYFGDGFQNSKRLEERRLWRIPVMDGEFVCEDYFGTVKAIGGGNLLICGTAQSSALSGARAAAEAIRGVAEVIMPFPSGIVRSGSKVGSRYSQLPASTNDAWCPTLRGQTATSLLDDEHCVYEIVIDGLSETAVAEAMRVGIRAASASTGVVRISAGNYGGKLGPHHFHLQQLISATDQHG